MHSAQQIPCLAVSVVPRMILHFLSPALAQELFGSLGRSLDRELDDVVPVLLKRAGEVSNAGEPATSLVVLYPAALVGVNCT